ncbi:unnamed protein product [Closterium sp. Naga37s-1]|nr:unnamed protein product [Closterium sp. Naga37s-1]
MSTADTSSPTNSTRTMSTVTSAAPSAAPSGPPVSMSSSSVTGTKALAKRAIRVAQAVADARLDSAYENESEGFDYHDSVEASKGITQTDGGQSGAQGGGKPGGAPVASYLQRMQRGGLIQAFGCLVVVEEATFNVLAFSENAKDLLGLIPKPKTEEELEAEKKAAEEEERKKAEEAAKAEAATASPSKASPAKSGIGRAFSSLKDKISSAIRGHNAASSKHSKERGRSAGPSASSGGRVGSPARSQSPSRKWRSGFRASRRAEDFEGAHSNLSKAGDADSAPPAPPPLPPLPNSPCRTASPLLSLPSPSPLPPLSLSPPSPLPLLSLPSPSPLPPLTLSPPSPLPPDFGVDARVLFTPDSVTALEKATGAADLSMINPVLVEAAVSNRGDHRPFYAILHRIDVGIVIDLEPIRLTPSPFSSPLLPSSPPSPPLSPSADFGVDARSLFTPDSVTALEKATGAADLSMINPVLVEAAVSNRGDHRPFYAILHRIDVGIVIDLEPIRDAENIFTGAGALQAHKLAAKAIARLQRMPPGDMTNLCQAVVEEVKELTGYDRVMTYKFHEDEHGEVLAEAKKESMEPYLGLHYPATDIPQAIRFLFMKNRVRCICDAYSDEVKVVRDEGRLKQPVTLAGSQLRAAQRCHIQYMRNMGTTASMTMAVIINDEDAAQPAQQQGAGGAAAAPAQANRGKKLWGLVVCHHETARYLPFPLRLACEFLMQVFSLQVNMELEMARQHREKEMLRTQTLLCDLLMRGDAPLGIVSQNPNIRDLVKCDGAALYYAGRFWLLGTTPTEMQILDIIDWLDSAHPDSSGLSTDSLAEAGYPRAEELGEGVCGMACARLYARDALLWFRSHVRKEVRWGGEKHDNRDKDDERPERMDMGPRASFAAFLEVVRQRSMPWEDVEMDAVHSLQLILRGHLTSFSDNDMRDMMLNRMRDQEMDRLSATESEMVRVLETATAPILAVDRDGCVTGWNARLAALTGLATGDALGKHLITDLVVEGNVDAVGRALFLALQGQESKELEIHLRTWGVVQSNKDSVILVVNAFASRGTAMGGDDMEDVVGVCFVGQDVTAQKAVQGKFTRLQGDYEAIVHGNNSLIPPIFSTDDFGNCTDWNPAMERITGVPRQQAIDRLLLGGIFGPICRMKADTMTKLMIVINKAMSGQMTDRYPLEFLDAHGQLVEALLTVQTRRDSDGHVTGVFCFLHTVSAELQAALNLQRATQDFAKEKAKAVAYTRDAIRGPLDGIEHALEGLRKEEQEGRLVGEEERNAVGVAERCKEQVDRILGDDDIDTIEEGYVNIIPAVFTIASVIDAVIAQGKQAASRRGVSLAFDPPQQLRSFPGLAGDPARLQQALAEYLTSAVAFTPQGGWVKVRLVTSTRSLFGDQGSLKCEFRGPSSPAAGPGGVPHECCCLYAARRVGEGAPRHEHAQSLWRPGLPQMRVPVSASSRDWGGGSEGLWKVCGGFGMGWDGLAGDRARLQQALAEYLTSAVAFTPQGGWVKVRLVTSTRSLFGDQGSLKCEFRVQHSGSLPQELVQQLYDEADPTTLSELVQQLYDEADPTTLSELVQQLYDEADPTTLSELVQQLYDEADPTARTQEGLGLSICRKILLAMAGDVQYDRNYNACEFVVRIGFPFA